MPRRRLDRLVFFGTPDFAVPTLEALTEAGRRSALVVTRPPRAAGRGRKATEPPVAKWARKHGLDVVQPERVSDAEFLDRVRVLKPRVAVVVAFGQIFPRQLLDLFPRGAINLHASLLPRYRGAAPIQAALLHRDRVTGVTTMLMEEELDSGPILLQRETPIESWERHSDLAERLARLGAELMVETLDQWEAGTLEPRRQRDESASYAPRIRKENGKVDWQMTAPEIQARLRAYTPWPGLYAYLQSRPVKILSATSVDWEQAPSGSVGTYLGLRQGRLAVLCGDGTILGIEMLQRADRQPVRALEFLNGERLRVGQRFV